MPTRNNRLLVFDDPDLEDVLKAIKEKTLISPPYLFSGRLLTFVAKRGFPPNFCNQFRDFQSYLRARFGVRLITVGGGVGCEKLNALLQGAKQDVELALERLRQMDPELFSRLRCMQVDFVTDEKTKQSMFVEKPSTPDRTFGKGKLGSEDFDSVKSLRAKINLELVELQHALIPQDGGAQRYDEFVEALDAVLEPMLNRGIANSNSATRLKNLGQSMFRIPGASGPSERILGAVERMAMRLLL